MPPTPEYVAARKLAALRRRRILLNNDGDDVFTAPEATVASFLAQRCNGIETTQIDTYIYATLSNFNSCIHDSRVAELETRVYPASPGNCAPALIAQGHDPLSVVIDFCRRHDLEIFWSARLNDTHDNWFPQMQTAFKKSYPQLRLYREGDACCSRNGAFQPHMYATAMDYGRPEVRDLMFGIIADVCRRYPVDGVDLDFMRDPIYFRPTMEGRAVEDEQIQLMTAWVKRVRIMIDEIGQARDKPLLLSVRVPHSLAACRYIGLDVEDWIESGLIDLVVPSLEFMPFGDIREIESLAHRAAIPVYPSLGPAAGGPEGWAAAASNLLAQGADGVAAYNVYETGFPAWNTIGETATLEKAAKTYELDNIHKIMATHFHIIERQGLLPLPLSNVAPIEAALPVYDELIVSRHSAVLGITIENCAPADKVEIGLNGFELMPEIIIANQGCAPHAVGNITYRAAVPVDVLVNGTNRISVSFAPVETRECTTILGALQLQVRPSGNELQFPAEAHEQFSPAAIRGCIAALSFIP